jgi:hypothetical protein
LYLTKYHNARRAVWAIPLVMVLWVNLHAGFAIGFILLFGFLIGEAVGKLLDPDEPHTLAWPHLRTLAFATVAGILALSLNPFGPRMIFYPFETAGIQTLNLFIQEWMSPNFKMPQTWPFVLLLGAIIVLAGRTQSRLAWSDLALVTGTLALALWSSRNIAVFAIVATPLAARQLDAWLTERGWQLEPSTHLSPRMIRLNWVLLAVVVLGALAKIGTTLASEEVREVHEEFLPVGAVAYLDENQAAGPMFNDYNWGGYFIFTLPAMPVFVDGRTDLYGDDFLEDYIRAILGAEEWRQPLDEYDIQLVVIQDDSALATLLREHPTEWRLVYEDDLSVIFERNE